MGVSQGKGVVRCIYMLFLGVPVQPADLVILSFDCVVLWGRGCLGGLSWEGLVVLQWMLRALMHMYVDALAGLNHHRPGCLGDRVSLQ